MEDSHDTSDDQSKNTYSGSEALQPQVKPVAQESFMRIFQRKLSEDKRQEEEDDEEKAEKSPDDVQSEAVPKNKNRLVKIFLNLDAKPKENEDAPESTPESTSETTESIKVIEPSLDELMPSQPVESVEAQPPVESAPKVPSAPATLESEVPESIQPTPETPDEVVSSRPDEAAPNIPTPESTPPDAEITPNTPEAEAPESETGTLTPVSPELTLPDVVQIDGEQIRRLQEQNNNVLDEMAGSDEENPADRERRRRVASGGVSNPDDYIDVRDAYREGRRDGLLFGGVILAWRERKNRREIKSLKHEQHDMENEAAETRGAVRDLEQNVGTTSRTAEAYQPPVVTPESSVPPPVPEALKIPESPSIKSPDHPVGSTPEAQSPSVISVAETERPPEVPMLIPESRPIIIERGVKTDERLERNFAAQLEATRRSEETRLREQRETEAAARRLEQATILHDKRLRDADSVREQARPANEDQQPVGRQEIFEQQASAKEAVELQAAEVTRRMERAIAVERSAERPRVESEPTPEAGVPGPELMNELQHETKDDSLYAVQTSAQVAKSIQLGDQIIKAEMMSNAYGKMSQEEFAKLATENELRTRAAIKSGFWAAVTIIIFGLLAWLYFQK